MDAEQYRRNARHFLVRARRMTNPGIRTLLIDIAIIWMRMAEIRRSTVKWVADMPVGAWCHFQHCVGGPPFWVGQMNGV
jgi:hypothetical protein